MYFLLSHEHKYKFPASQLITDLALPLYMKDSITYNHIRKKVKRNWVERRRKISSNLIYPGIFVVFKIFPCMGDVPILWICYFDKTPEE